MSTVVLLPWRTDNAERARIYPHVRREVDMLGFEVFEADSTGPVFSISEAWNRAAAAAGDWNRAVLHVADMYADPVAIAYAVDLSHDGVAYAFDRLVRLNSAGTELFLQGQRTGFEPPHLRRRQHKKPPGLIGGPRVIPRKLFDAVGGFPAEYVGYGFEDMSFALKCQALAPAVWVEGDALELWHPKRQDKPDDPYYSNYDANRERFLAEKHA